MFRIKISGNFFLILNSNGYEHIRHESNDVNYIVLNEDSSPIIRFNGLEHPLNPKFNKQVEFKLSELVNDATSSLFTSLSNFKNHLDHILGDNELGGTSALNMVDNNDGTHTITDTNNGASITLSGATQPSYPLISLKLGTSAEVAGFNVDTTLTEAQLLSLVNTGVTQTETSKGVYKIAGGSNYKIIAVNVTANNNTLPKSIIMADYNTQFVHRQPYNVTVAGVTYRVYTSLNLINSEINIAIR